MAAVQSLPLGLPHRLRMYTHIGQTATLYKSQAKTCVPIGRKIRVRSPPDASAPVARVGSLRNSQTRREIRYKTRGLVAPPSGPKARPARGASLRTNDVRKDRGQGPRSRGRSLQNGRDRSFLGPTSESLCRGPVTTPHPLRSRCNTQRQWRQAHGGPPSLAAGVQEIEG